MEDGSLCAPVDPHAQESFHQRLNCARRVAPCFAMVVLSEAESPVRDPVLVTDRPARMRTQRRF